MTQFKIHDSALNGIRHLMFDGAPIFDDEGCGDFYYRFLKTLDSAQLTEELSKISYIKQMTLDDIRKTDLSIYPLLSFVSLGDGKYLVMILDTESAIYRAHDFFYEKEHKQEVSNEQSKV